MAILENSRVLRTIPLLIVVCLVSMPAQAQYGDGTGEPNDPYQIATAEDLILLGESPDDYDKNFILTADIDMDPNLPGRKVFDKAVIGVDWLGFTGVFDGNGHTILHLTIAGESYLGLFGKLGSEAKISNVGLEAVDVNGIGDSIGGLVGYNGGNITTSYSTGTVNGNHFIGGLVGNNKGNITNCYSTGTVSGDHDVGGLVGYNVYGDVNDCYSTGMVSGNWYVGGLVGSNNYGSISSSQSTSLVTGNYNEIGGLVGRNHYGSISSSQSISTVDGNSGVGGLVGWNLGSISSSYSISEVMGTGRGVGGLVGSNSSSISSSHSIGEVSGSHSVGGLVGHSYSRSEISNCFSTSTVTSYSWGGLSVGGLVGCNFGNISLSNSTGKVTAYGSASTYVGGLVGTNYSNIRTSYSTSMVNGANLSVGGLVGFNTGSITTSFCTGAVTGKIYTGGLVGYDSRGSIYNCYSTSGVDGEDSIGGLVGWNNSLIFNCYSTGEVNGVKYIGGLVGQRYIQSSTEFSFWDTQTSGQSTSKGGTGKTTAEMQTASTFINAGWDFIGETVNGPNDIWWINEGQDYPKLWWEKYGGGTGESNDPYLIYTAEHLNAIGTEPNDWGKHFKLIADIDLSGYSYDNALIAPDVDPCEPGFQEISFTGVFDGNGHRISNLMITGENYVGLFGQLELGAEIKNLGLTDVNITGFDYVGGFVGFSKGNIATSYCTGAITGDKRIGGLTGRNWHNITESYSTVTVTGNDNAGGIAGGNYGSITNSYNTGAVTANWDAGGLVGENYGSIATSYSTGTVSGTTRAGGLVGYNWPDTGIASGFWDIEASGLSTSDGGTALTTAEMQTASTFLDASWDFVDETANGTEDIWWILEDQGYPRLWWEASD